MGVCVEGGGRGGEGGGAEAKAILGDGWIGNAGEGGGLGTRVVLACPTCLQVLGVFTPLARWRLLSPTCCVSLHDAKLLKKNNTHKNCQESERQLRRTLGPTSVVQTHARVNLKKYASRLESWPCALCIRTNHGRPKPAQKTNVVRRMRETGRMGEGTETLHVAWKELEWPESMSNE